MQGRLSPQVNGRIQAFPPKHWKSEFKIAEKIGIKKIEWTIDDEGFYENPLLSSKGRKKIKELLNKHKIKLNSVTADCLMQAPFWKMSGKKKVHHEKKFIDLALSSSL